MPASTRRPNFGDAHPALLSDRPLGSRADRLYRKTIAEIG
jgi:hypothetical protein